MKFKKPMFFREEDGSPSGSGESAPAAVPQHQQQAPASSTPAFDPKALATEFASVLEDRDKKREASAPKTYTPEQIAEARKALKFWEPDDTFISEFGNLETQKAAFGKLRDGLMAQNVEIVKALLAQRDEEWNGRFQPIQQMLTQREESEREARFHSAYPILAKPELKTLLLATGQQLAAAGKFNGLSESEAFAELAKGVESVMKISNPEFSLGVPASQQNQPGRNGNQIPVTSAGSGGGGGNGSNGTKSVSTAASILGPVRTPRK